MTPKYFKFCSFSVKYKSVFEKSKFILSWAIREFRTLDFSLVHLRVRYTGIGGLRLCSSDSAAWHKPYYSGFCSYEVQS